MAERRLLTDLVMDEVSLVDDPANPFARVVIAKAKGAPCADCKSPDVCKAAGKCKQDKGDQHVGKSAEVVAAVREAIAKLAPAIMERVGAAFPDDEEAADLAASILKERDMDLEELAKALANAEAALKKGEDVVKVKDAELKAKDEEIVKLKGERDAAVAKAKDAEATDEDVLKSLPEPLRKRFLALEASDKAKDAEIAKMRTDAEEREAIAKAAELKVGDAKVLGPILLRIRKGTTTADDAAQVEQLLKASAAQAQAGGLFQTLGSTVSDVADPEAVLKAKAAEIKKANPKLSHEQAYTQALDENPDLYNAYVAKRR